MKKAVLFLMFVVCTYSQTNNINTTFGNIGYVTATLTGSVDTIEVVPAGMSGKKFDYITVVASSTAVDTVSLWTLSRADTTTWIQKAVIDMSSGSAVTALILSTTVKEFLLPDPQPFKVRLVSPSDDGSTDAIIIQGKYGIR